MNIQFKNTHGGLAPAFQERIERKLAKLSRLTDTKESVAIATFTLERAVGSHHTGDVWEAIVNIDANGETFHAAELAETPEKVSNKVLKEIRTELKKVRGKRKAIARRSSGFWKAFQQRLTRTDA